jgi:uncharacterized protein YjbJ (UPF0337 family)
MYRAGSVRKEHHMDNVDQVKGKLKQAAGDLTGNKDLKDEGKVDEASGKAKHAVDSAKEKLGDAIDSVKDKLKH